MGCVQRLFLHYSQHRLSDEYSCRSNERKTRTGETVFQSTIKMKKEVAGLLSTGTSFLSRFIPSLLPSIHPNSSRVFRSLSVTTPTEKTSNPAPLDLLECSTPFQQKSDDGFSKLVIESDALELFFTHYSVPTSANNRAAPSDYNKEFLTTLSVAFCGCEILDSCQVSYTS